MAKKEDGSYDNLYPKLNIPGFIDGLEYLNRDVPIFLPPSCFSRVSFPDKDYMFKGLIKHKPGYKNPDTDRPDNLIGTGTYIHN